MYDIILVTIFWGWGGGGQGPRAIGVMREEDQRCYDGKREIVSVQIILF